MTNDSTASATKGDVTSAVLQSENRVINELKTYIDEKQTETHRHFRTVTDQLAHDYVGIFDDRTRQHSDKLGQFGQRLDRIEEMLHLPQLS